MVILHTTYDDRVGQSGLAQIIQATTIELGLRFFANNIFLVVNSRSLPTSKDGDSATLQASQDLAPQWQMWLDLDCLKTCKIALFCLWLGPDKHNDSLTQSRFLIINRLRSIFF